MIQAILKRGIYWISRLFTGRELSYRTIYMEELPDSLDAHAIYVLGEGEHTWAAVMVCPCGCGEILYMSLLQEGRPQWNLNRHSNGTVSLSPSIWRKVGCHSHFFFEQGRIRWCK